MKMDAVRLAGVGNEIICVASAGREMDIRYKVHADDKDFPEEMEYWDAYKIAQNFKPWLDVNTIHRLIEIDVEAERGLGLSVYGRVIWHALSNYQQQEITDAYNSGKWDPDNSRFEGNRW